MKILRVLSFLAVISPLFYAACEKEIEVASISISQPSAEIETGESLFLMATVSPSNAAYDGLTWTSTNPQVASVSDSGKVSAISEGNTTIIVMAGGKTASCSITVVKGFVTVSSISLNKTMLEMVEGDTESLTAKVSPDDATDKTVTWSSSNEDVAKVQDGTVTAVKEGESTISAKAGEKTASCKVIVSKKVIDVESIELNSNELIIVEGESETLVATVKPEDATDKTVSWTSADENIATVSESGIVTAIKEGETIVTATSGAKQASCKVVVQKKIIDVTGISLDRNTLELYEGTTATLSATVLPENATDKTVTWNSSDASIATVSNGEVTAIKIGEATITATSGDKTASCQVTVKQHPVVSSLSLRETSINGYIDKDYSVTATISPSDAQYNLVWTSSNARVADVRGSGLSGTIHTKDFGKSVITVKDQITGMTASLTISTVVEDFEWKENTGYTYSGFPLITIYVGDEYQLHYSCSPTSATHLFEDLSNFVFYEPTSVVETPSVISIDTEGKITGMKEGTIGIKPTGRIIKSSSGSDRIYITVKAKTIAVSEIRLDQTSLSLNVGDSQALTATVLPEYATDKTITWSSSNTAVATVDSNGTVKAISGGSATITATAGGVSASCTLTVTVPVASISLNKTELTLKIGASESLTVTISPSNATNKSVTWKSDNTDVVTVNNGKVTAVDQGTAIITVTTKDGAKSATCVVTVLPSGNTESVIDNGQEHNWD